MAAATPASPAVGYARGMRTIPTPSGPDGLTPRRAAGFAIVGMGALLGLVAVFAQQWLLLLLIVLLVGLIGAPLAGPD